MRVAAISMAGIKLDSVSSYREDLTSLIKKSDPDLAVLPAYSSILLGMSSGALEPVAGFNKIIRNLNSNNAAWNREFLEVHSSIARDLGMYIAAGTLFEADLNHCYHSAYCFDSNGDICCKQLQTHLSRTEREVGLSRGEELKIFPLGDLKGGLVIGNDARCPEVGRIFGLRGADILLHNGALKAGFNCWPQAAGMWAQVQQNQFWAAEAQLSGQIADCAFGAPSSILGPCEITPGQSGYLSRGYPETPLVTAELDEEARSEIQKKYPLLELLNPAAYFKELF